MTKKQRKIFYPTIFILGLSLMAWQITIFRNTIIDLKILIGIILIVGITTFLVDYKNYGKTYKYSGIGLYFYSSIHYLCGFGFMACSIFILTNYYFADKTTVKKTYEIIERSSLPGEKYQRDERKPTFQINYDGKIKELVFNNEYYEKMDFFTNVELEVKKGYFGFDILENKKLN
ncbi:hypothetical protein [Tenacibaculum finnmarkense]|uniref:hypothetical protein n=1 Tax=Tenacibaculum finnmarkense TaxID=2781243 RepID=UPI00187B3182|nr:hypothetical protein [Tenacibaculum finnmarkense]MBE7661495.1 hypothetical protein [Tenacibaculum finnmarkense genomovar finnmarkense]MCG8252859.1 hypothetical protein [Tenacibaculum finnmarkense genomovar finnmarkense]MCG8816545.1 hypothetical protein [Tenacibaculum finnmarkense]